MLPLRQELRGSYAWDLSGFLRSGGKLSQLLDAFQDQYAPKVRARVERPAPVAVPARSADRGVAGGPALSFCKVR